MAALLLTLGLALVTLGMTVAPEKFAAYAVPMVVGGIACLVLAGLLWARGRITDSDTPPPPPQPPKLVVRPLPPKKSPATVLSDFRNEGERLHDSVLMNASVDHSRQLIEWAGKVQRYLLDEVSKDEAEFFARASGRQVPTLPGIVTTYDRARKDAVATDTLTYIDRLGAIIARL